MTTKRIFKSNTQIGTAKIKQSTPKPTNTKWKKEEFFSLCEIDFEMVEQSKLDWEELANIYDEHLKMTRQLNTAASYIADRLRDITQVHSVRVRIKDPRNLVRKIIRKRIDNESRDIKFDNYQQEITDLIGIRALHLYKKDWLEIHSFIKKEWELAETPIANIRAGDDLELSKSYKENSCEVKIHSRKYRSIHYSIKSAASKVPIIAELQTRTLFEEAWSEIDHQINYPQTVNHIMVALYLELFNRYAGSADEMGSLLQFMVADLRLRDFELKKVADERDEALRKIEELTNESKMSEAEKTEMEKELQKLRNTQNPLESATSATAAMAASQMFGIDFSSVLGKSVFGSVNPMNVGLAFPFTQSKTK